MSELFQFPRLITSIKSVESDVEDHKENNREINEEIGEVLPDTVDLTSSITELFTRNPKRIEEITKGNGLFVHEISSSLDWKIRGKAQKRQVAFPNLVKDTLEFAHRVQEVGSFAEFKEHLSTLSNLEYSLELARRELAVFEKSQWTTDLAQFDMFYSSFAREEYFTDPEDEFESWGWDKLVKEHPMPEGAAYGSDEYKVWEQEFIKVQRKVAPPYSYGTKPQHWPGISAAAIREQFEDEGTVDAWSIVESDLEDYHEDAIDSVVDDEELEKIVKDWLEVAGSGMQEDKNLEVKIEAWNKKQSIFSYYVNEAFSVPNFKGVTREESKAWLENSIAGKQLEIAQAEQAWLDRSVAVQAIKTV